MSPVCVSGRGSSGVHLSHAAVLERRPRQQTQLPGDIQAGEHTYLSRHTLDTLTHTVNIRKVFDRCVLAFMCVVQECESREEDQHHRLHAEDAGAVLLQPGGADKGAD